MRKLLERHENLQSDRTKSCQQTCAELRQIEADVRKYLMNKDFKYRRISQK